MLPKITIQSGQEVLLNAHGSFRKGDTVRVDFSALRPDFLNYFQQNHLTTIVLWRIKQFYDDHDALIAPWAQKGEYPRYHINGSAICDLCKTCDALVELIEALKD